MAQKFFDIPGVGPVLVSKRRGSRNIRLSINSKGQARVSLPSWTPYAVGVAFARERRDWIAKHSKSNEQLALKENDRIGKSYRLKFYSRPQSTRLSARVSSNEIAITVPPSASPRDVQQKAVAASEKALRAEAETLLPHRLKQLSIEHGYSYKSVRIAKLTSRWGSCSSTGQISLSYFLVQLPWQFIDYVIIHELVHTRHHNHGAGFWSDFKTALPEARQLQKQIRKFKPIVQATN